MAIKQDYKRHTYDKVREIRELIVNIEGKSYYINDALDYVIEDLKKKQKNKKRDNG